MKALDGPESTYAPAKRAWLKVKKDYLASAAGDTLDLVVLGADFGQGKRAGAYGGFLLACYDPDSERYEAITKCGTGFSEADLKQLYEVLQPLIIDTPRSDYLVPNSGTTDAWFSPKLVFEVRCADLSISPLYKAAVGKVDTEKGIALRFPRFVRLRDDKAAEQATSADQVAEMYRKQAVVASAVQSAAKLTGKKRKREDEEDS